MAGRGVVQQDHSILKTLGHVSVLRGGHSTGMVQVNSKDLNKWATLHVEKMSGDFGYFEWFHRTQAKGNKVLLNSTMHDVFMGHCRYATVGDVNDKNAHPFKFENIVGMHNGTLKDEKYLAKGMTDSEQMFTDMNVRGIPAVLRELVAESAYAISVYDRVMHEVVFARNEKRTLYCAQLLERDVVYWASEKAMLDFVLTRADVKYKVYYFDPGFVYYLDTAKVSRTNHDYWEKVPLAEERNPKEAPKIIEHVTHKIGRRNQGAGKSNVLGFPVRGKVKAPITVRNVIHHNCVNCLTPLNLMDQHFARQNDDCTFTCVDCVEIEETKGLKSMSFLEAGHLL